MAKKKKKPKGDIFDSLISWKGAVLFLFLILIVLAFTGKIGPCAVFNIDLNEILAGLGLRMVGLPEMNGYEPEDHESCDDYNIGQEYRIDLGDAGWYAWRDTCLGIEGIWISRYNEISCAWHPDVASIDCNSANAIASREFCEEDLKASWYCDNSLAYAGCRCMLGTPFPFPGPSPFDEEPKPDGIIDTCTFVPGTITVLAHCEGECIREGYYGYCEPIYQSALTTTIIDCECYWEPIEDDGDITSCEDVDAQSAFESGIGDLGGYCAENGDCSGSIYSCSHYWDWNEKTHKCGCTDKYFCQYCFWYDPGLCECPPNSHEDWNFVGEVQCIPDGHSCSDEGDVI